VLALIAACAVAAAVAPAADAERAPDPEITTAAVGLAVATIVSRRASTSPVIRPRTAFVLLLCAFGFAFALSLLGAFVAQAEGDKQLGLVFAFAAAIFCLRPPAPVGARA
jgi:CDP-diglyceride synthetase